MNERKWQITGFGIDGLIQFTVSACDYASAMNVANRRCYEVLSCVLVN